jgi:hypothetical protein
MAPKQIVVAVGAAVAVAALFVALWKAPPGKEYRTFHSPDLRFKIVVYRSRQWLGMPGQSGDAPGTVCLFEETTGKLLRRRSVEMVQLVEEVSWSPTNVWIKFLGEWNLP